MKEYRFSAGIWAFGSCMDRFCESGYQKPRTFTEKVSAASKVNGLDGIEIHYNGDFNRSNAKEIKGIIEGAGLKVAAINCETFGDPKFRKGALISRDPAIRQEALDIVKTAGEMAEFFNASLVNLWPGADGYDYPFQIDYFEQWELFLNSLKEVVGTLPGVRFSLEYKIREPRIRSTMGTAGRALLVAREIGADNLGVTIDFGHSLMARENPAEAAALLSRYNKLFHVHLNDNSRDWDDDLIVNTYHFWETLEFIYYLHKSGYDGWISLDMTPKREDQIQAVEYCIRTIKEMFNLVEELDTEELTEALNNADALASYKFLSQKIFR